MSEDIQPNAGRRLWDAQKQQGTGLCIGLDHHYDPNSPLNFDFYRQFADDQRRFDNLCAFIEASNNLFFLQSLQDRDRLATFLSGMVGYFYRVIDVAWREGIVVFKPQAAFYERGAWFGNLILSLLCERIAKLVSGSN